MNRTHAGLQWGDVVQHQTSYKNKLTLNETIRFAEEEDSGRTQTYPVCAEAWVRPGHTPTLNEIIAGSCDHLQVRPGGGASKPAHKQKANNNILFMWTFYIIM